MAGVLSEGKEIIGGGVGWGKMLTHVDPGVSGGWANGQTSLGSAVG